MLRLILTLEPVILIYLVKLFRFHLNPTKRLPFPEGSPQATALTHSLALHRDHQQEQGSFAGEGVKCSDLERARFFLSRK